MIEYYHLPGVQTFESFAGLFEQLDTCDVQHVLKLQLEHTRLVRERSTTQAARMLSRIRIAADTL